MDAGYNEEENDMELNSIRRKYKGGRRGKNINYGIVLKATKKEIMSELEQEKPILKQEKIIINQEIQNSKTLTVSPIESTSKISKTRTVIQGGDAGKSKQQITTTITKSEIKESSEGKNNLGAFSRFRENRGAGASQKTTEVTKKRNINTNNNINNNSRVGSQGRQIKEEYTTKIITTSTSQNQLGRMQNTEKKENEKKIVASQSNERRNRGGKEETTTKTITTTTTLNQRTGNESPGRSAQKGKITSIKTVTNKLSTTNERQSSREKSQNQSQGKTIEIKKEVNTVQRQNSRDNKGSRKDVIKQVNVNTNQRPSSRDSRNSQKEIIKQVDTYQNQNNRNKSQGPSKNQKIESPPIQRSNSRGKSQGQKSESRNEVNVSQRNSRRESNNSRNQVIKEVTSTTSVNKRNAGKAPTVTENKTVTKVKQNYTFTQDPKNKKTKHTGLSISSTNQINVKEQDHNKRSNAGRNISSNKNDNEKPIKTDKVEKNIIQVQKVLVTDTANNKQKKQNQKSKPVLISTKNNYNTNNNKTNQYNTNTNINNRNVSKLALKDIKDQEQKPYLQMTNFNRSRHNLSRITINESGKTPKKQYVLNVRKLDRIQSKSKIRLIYTNNMEERDPVKTDFNHKIVVIRNINKDKNNGDKYSNNTFNSNIGRKEINESGKIVKKQVMVSPRKNEIIKSEKKPFKLTYINFLDNNKPINQILSKKIEVKTNLNNKMNQAKINTHNETEKRNSRRNSNNSRESRNSRNGKQNININKVTLTETNIKIRRGIESNENKRGRFNNLQIGKTGNSNDASSKLITIKKTQINGNGSRNNSRGNSVSKNANIVSTTKTITKTTSEVKFSQSGGDGAVVKKVKSVRRIKKENA
jgi:hypothetical protein